MGERLKMLMVLLGGGFSFTVIYFLIHRKINERNSMLWLLGSFAIILFSLLPKILDKISYLLGVDYPPTLLFLVAILTILFILLNQTIQISILQDRCRELTQRLAIINFSREGKSILDLQDEALIKEDDKHEKLVI